MAYEQILVEKEDGVIILTLNRPERMNAITMTIIGETSEVLQQANADDDVKAVVITGAGKAFCSGNDFADAMAGIDIKRPGLNRNTIITPFVSFGRFMEQFENFRKPLIAAVNGVASGLGLGIATACDIRIASESARFGTIFVKRGMMPDAGLTYNLPRIVGAGKALELLWSGDFIDAQEARRIGLANWVVPADKLVTDAKSYAKKLAAGPSLVIEMDKQLIRDSMRAPSLSVQMANEHFAVNMNAQTEDCIEGVTAFMEKRDPKFKGR